MGTGEFMLPALTKRADFDPGNPCLIDPIYG